MNWAIIIALILLTAMLALAVAGWLFIKFLCADLDEDDDGFTFDEVDFRRIDPAKRMHANSSAEWPKESARVRDIEPRGA